jgi:hypothetical protein
MAGQKYSIHLADFGEVGGRKSPLEEEKKEKRKKDQKKTPYLKDPT